MEIKDMKTLRKELSKLENVDLLSTGNEKDRIKFFKKLSLKIKNKKDENFRKIVDKNSI